MACHQRFRSSIIAFSMAVASLASITAFADTVKTEVIEEVERKEIKSFCAKKSADDAKKQCLEWLAVQKKSLGNRLLTSYCSPGQMVSDKAAGCLYQAKGEVKYILKKYKVETISR